MSLLKQAHSESAEGEKTNGVCRCKDNRTRGSRYNDSYSNNR